MEFPQALAHFVGKTGAVLTIVLLGSHLFTVLFPLFNSFQSSAVQAGTDAGSMSPKVDFDNQKP
jgi:hypothetical protein